MRECQVEGCHNPPDYRCGICEKSICRDHVVNRAYLTAGDEVGCPDHKHEIDQENRAAWEERKMR